MSNAFKEGVINGFALVFIALPLLSLFAFAFFDLQLWVEAPPGSTREMLVVLFHVCCPLAGAIALMKVQL